MAIDLKQPLKDSFRVLKLISKNQDIDLNKIDFITPFLITPLSAYLKENKKIKFVEHNNNDMRDYLNYIKFPIGISTNDFNDLNKIKTYFPLFCFSENDITSGDIIDKFTKCLEQFVVPLENKSLVYQPLDELIDNIKEHAFSNNCFIHAQIYQKKYLALSIVDIGKTIPQNYLDAGFKLENDLEAFQYILNGISSTKDPNRGFGLNSNINIITSALNGAIIIVSGKAILSKIGNEEPIIYDLKNYNLNFDGTFINILFEIPSEKLEFDIYKYLGKKKIYF